MLVCEGVGVFTSMPGGTAGDSTLVPAIWGREFFYCFLSHFARLDEMTKESKMSNNTNNSALPYKIYLQENEMPTHYYNVRADMKDKPAPLVNQGTGKPVTFDDLKPVFCDELIEQELNDTDRYIEIPEEIRDFYKMYRPSPLVRAYCLEEKLQTPAKIYYKFEGNNTSGSHKHRLTTLRRRGSKESQPRLVLASGELPYPWLALTSV